MQSPTTHNQITGRAAATSTHGFVERRSGVDRRAIPGGGRRATDRGAAPASPSPRQVPVGPVSARRPLPGQLVAIDVAARFIGMSESWLYKRCEKNLAPYRRVGWALRFDLDELREWARTLGNTARGPRKKRP
ncbi:MAG TPA: helix-turn-helix domain-containing protein [Gemmatimonadaceae bacterium]|nr:helix-turn-helix domain-containing protein [Gemmatimonadaceae bacterium]